VALVTQAAEVFGIAQDRITDAHLLGIQNVEAETTEYDRRVRAHAAAVGGRLTAEGEAMVARVQGNYEARLNALLASPGGRAYVAYRAAENVHFAEELVFRSSDGVPSVLRLSDFARQFMGR
jgi:hypothetical protein